MPKTIILISNIYVLFVLVTLAIYLPRILGFRYAFKKFPHEQKVKSKRRIAILIPARNESAIIRDILDSIKAQDYDKDYFEAFVIVKDYNDPTIGIANEYGANVTVIPSQRSKGEALSGFFSQLSKEKFELFDAFVIADADGVLSTNYLSELNAALEYDADIIVTNKRAKNFLGGRECRSVFSNCSALTYPIVDDFGNAYRTKKGMPLNICGQGLMIRRHVIEEIGGWPYKTMTEDYELKLDSLVRGYTSLYYPYAVIYTEEALSHKENFNRRVRWLVGYKQCDKKYKKSIKNKVREKKRINKGEFEYFFGLAPYFLFLADTALAVVLGLGFTIAYAIKGYSYWFYPLLALTVFPLLFLYLILYLFSVAAILNARAAFKSITKRECFAAALFNPFYLLEYVCVYFASLKSYYGKNSITWKQTERITKSYKSKKLSKKEKIEGVQNTLESHRRFSMETIDYGEKWSMPNGKYRYRPAWYDKLAIGFWRTVLLIFGPILIKTVFKAKVIGKKNLKAVKKSGAITICNHFHYLDTLFVRQAIGHINSFHTMAPWNNKNGIGGHIIRHGGMMPLSSDYTAMKNFSLELEHKLKNHKLVNFYPEHSMWWNYQKPRPMKKGAFHYAVKYDVPILPIFCTFKKSNRGGAKKVRIHILPPIYADKSLSVNDRIEKMKSEAEKEWRKCYESEYGKLEYLPDCRKVA